MKRMKDLCKAFAVAFSMYSKIPMPGFVWKSEDMRFHLLFFPWVGAVIGGMEWGLFMLADRTNWPSMFVLCMAAVIPLLITGGFHVDGFMDTCDALHSYQERERKLEILKDPHIGAFSVICLVMYLLLLLGFMSLLKPEAVGCLCFGFFLTRVLSGISVVDFPTAKKEGMLHTSEDTAAKKVVKAGLLIQCGGCVGLMCVFGATCAAGVLLGIFGTYLYYYKMSLKQFGGVTGDLAGYFVTMAELMMVIGAVCAQGIVR